MVHLVCLLNGPEIGTIGLAPYFDTLMNQQVMNEEMSQAIQCNAQPPPKTYIKASSCALYEEQAAKDSKNEEKEVIPCQHLFVLGYDGPCEAPTASHA